MQSEIMLHALQPPVAVLESGANLELLVLTGTLLPVSPTQAIPVPITLYRVPFANKKAAVEFHENLGKLLKEMPEDVQPSSLIVANDVRQADAMAKQMSQFKKNG